MKRSGIIIIILIVLAGCSQKDRLTDFTETHHPEKSYFLYPSTLRMVNLENNEDFNEMISELVRARYFSYPKSESNAEDFINLKNQLLADGYVELFTVKNKEISADVFLLENKVPLIFAFIKNDNQINLLEIEGMINPMKIPKLMETFNEDQFLNLFSLEAQNHNNPHLEHTEDKQPE